MVYTHEVTILVKNRTKWSHNHNCIGRAECFFWPQTFQRSDFPFWNQLWSQYLVYFERWNVVADLKQPCASWSLKIWHHVEGWYRICSWRESTTMSKGDATLRMESLDSNYFNRKNSTDNLITVLCCNTFVITPYMIIWWKWVFDILYETFYMCGT